ncbi:MAG: hypothetical protein VCA36_06340 [Opitutales bacterium]
MNKTFIIAAGWLATVGLSFWAGRFLGSADSNVPRLFEGEKTTEEEVSGDGNKPIDLAVKPAPTAPITPPREEKPPNPAIAPWTPPSPDQIGAVSGSDLITRWGTFIDGIRAMNPGNVDQVLAQFESMPSGYQRNMEMRLLMQAWGRFDPTKALDYAKGLDSTEGRLAVTEIMTAWSQKDPDAALAWIDENVDPTEANRQGYLPGLISGIASHDLARANELLGSITDRNARWQASSLLLRRYLEQSPENAMTWANSLPNDDPNFRNGILGQVGAEIAKRNPKQCAAWAESLEPGEGRNRVVSALIAHWSRKNPSEAAEWAGQLADVSTRVHGMTQVVNYWAFKNAAETAQWLDNYPRTQETDPVVQTFVNRVTSRDPENAAKWANVIMDEQRRDASVRQVLRTWNRLNPSAAEAWRQANAPHISAGGGAPQQP